MKRRYFEQVMKMSDEDLLQEGIKYYHPYNEKRSTWRENVLNEVARVRGKTSPKGPSAGGILQHAYNLVIQAWRSGARKFD